MEVRNFPTKKKETLANLIAGVSEAISQIVIRSAKSASS
jgi:hypothetical protein